MSKTYDYAKTYAAKSSVTRALKAAGIDAETVHINNGPDGWYATPKEPPKKVAGVKKERSGACRKVWDICDSMRGQRRKDVVAACVAAGINPGTARTQYQAWLASTRA